MACAGETAPSQIRRATEASIDTRPVRASTEVDRRHLLAPSIAPSEPNDDSVSILTYTTQAAGTPRATSPTPSQASTLCPEETPYRSFPSRAAYLSALQAWAETKKFLDQDEVAGDGRAKTLRGFYGDVTMEEIGKRPGLELGWRRRWRERRESRAAKSERQEGVQGRAGERRMTVA